MEGTPIRTVFLGTPFVGHPDELLVFSCILAHCDENGNSDAIFKLISGITGISDARVRRAVKAIESEGFIERRYDHLEWGWKVKDHERFLYSRSEIRRREHGREAQARYRARLKKEAA